MKFGTKWEKTSCFAAIEEDLILTYQAVAEVEDWVNRWKEVKNLLKELSDSSRSILPSVLASKMNPTIGCKKPLSSKVVRQQRSQTAAKCLKR